MVSIVHRRKYLTTVSTSVIGLLLAGCSSESAGPDPEGDSGESETSGGSESDDESSGDEDSENTGTPTDGGDTTKFVLQTYLEAFFSKDAETVNGLHLEEGLVEDYQKSQLFDAEYSIERLEESETIDESESDGGILETESITLAKRYLVTVETDVFDGGSRVLEITLVLKDDEWRVADLD